MKTIEKIGYGLTGLAIGAAALTVVWAPKIILEADHSARADESCRAYFNDISVCDHLEMRAYYLDHTPRLP